MITVHVHRSHGRILSFEMKGHADSGPYGYDLVCAGVSAVTFGALNAVEVLTDITLDILQGDDGGYLKVSFPHSANDDRSQLLLEGMIVSLRTIEESYGEHITINNEGGV